VAKMTSSIPLIDEDRWPWLKAIAAEINSRNGTVVASCSALKYAYRAQLRESINKSVTFVWLNISRSVLEQRLSARKGHFMPTELLDSQLQVLEPPGATEQAIVIDDADTAQAMCTLLSRLKG
jgi:gluconokinase